MIERPASSNSFWVMHCIRYELVFNPKELQFKLVHGGECGREAVKRVRFLRQTQPTVENHVT